jgi:hypothetical protein
MTFIEKKIQKLLKDKLIDLQLAKTEKVEKVEQPIIYESE